MPSLLETKGVPLDLQKFTWREMVQQPISKLDDDAFTRVKVILMNGIEMEAIRFQHSFARMCPDPELRHRDEERQHLSTLRQWYRQATMQEARLLS